MTVNILNTNKKYLNSAEATCYHCPNRCLGCHTYCGEYKKWSFTRKILSLMQMAKTKESIEAVSPKKRYMTILKRTQKIPITPLPANTNLYNLTIIK